MPSENPTVIQIRSAIEAALRALPIKDPDRANVIPYSALIPGIARHVMRMRRPNNMKSVRKRAIADLDKIVAGTEKLADLIEDQFPNEEKDLANPRIRMTMLLPVAAVEEAIQLLDSLKQFGATVMRARNQRFGVSSRGGVRKTEALEIGIYLYEQFERLTAKKPTRTVRNGKASGQFLTLLKEVFEVLSIRASAEGTTVRVMEEMKKREEYLTPFD